MNWKRVYTLEDIIGELVLLREKLPYSQHISFYAGTIQKDMNDEYYIQTSESKVNLFHKEDIYHYILINEILF